MSNVAIQVADGRVGTVINIFFVVNAYGTHIDVSFRSVIFITALCLSVVLMFVLLT